MRRTIMAVPLLGTMLHPSIASSQDGMDVYSLPPSRESAETPPPPRRRDQPPPDPAPQKSPGLRVRNMEMVIIGSVITAGGAAGIVTGGVLAGTSDSQEQLESRRPAILVAGAAGLLFMGLGIPLIVLGARPPKSEFGSASTTIAAGPGEISVSGRF